MKTLLLTAAACLALSACTTTSIDTAIQKNLPKTCDLIETAHVAFSAVAITGKISARKADVTIKTPGNAPDIVVPAK